MKILRPLSQAIAYVYPNDSTCNLLISKEVTAKPGNFLTNQCSSTSPNVILCTLVLLVNFVWVSNLVSYPVGGTYIKGA
jgi:hypothetical protein